MDAQNVCYFKEKGVNLNGRDLTATLQYVVCQLGKNQARRLIWQFGKTLLGAGNHDPCFLLRFRQDTCYLQ